MFEKITSDEALIAIRQLESEDNLRKTTYAVWWKGKLISPSAIISKHFEIIGNPINRNSFDTNQAQKTLLNLGFPIVDTSRDDGFFTEKELNSFSQLIKNRFYDKSKPVDKNIGEFISNVIWKKTKKWRDKLLELGWFKDNDRYTWQTQSSSKQGNNYKQYTWYRVYHLSNTKKLIFFTVGVGSNGALEYKLDIQANHDFFTDEDRHWFYTNRSLLGADMLTISKDEIVNENWSSLLKKTDDYFKKNLSVLEKISSHFWPEKRLMRLVWNDNNWQFPITRNWNKKWQGKKDKAHHEQFGFGFEEWLFNKRYLIDGSRYGYIRGVASMPKDISFIDELHLYSIHPISKQQFIIGVLKNVNIYHEIDEVDEKVVDVFERNRSLMLKELAEVEADTKLLKTLELRPNLSFSVEDAIIYQEPILINQDVLKIHRFIPRIIESDLELLIEEVDLEIKDPKMKFDEGNGTGSNSYSQNVSGGKRNVNRTHADITNDLHEYLTQSEEYKNFEISTEKTRISNNLVDCAAKKGNVYILFEVKTANSVLACIRQALGQIIEYAILDVSLKIEQLIIIGPVTPTECDLTYLQNLKSKLKLPLHYWSYSVEEKNLSMKFKTH
ncbi:hypothetical protein C7447_101840 [Tenacibaculum adriaticum]|uniref:Uncharacterized protein n=1 Tax=Tenacibaculum adriaticum TaxID=413713 RepID=A0A5S5E0H0_9FLAO|nr:hypothetical protein [Tenacibaculum adriaticum]TYQ00230.1 hypothetical protein C7447_101840 [Tenacibaculum adriaticum]